MTSALMYMEYIYLVQYEYRRHLNLDEPIKKAYRYKELQYVKIYPKYWCFSILSFKASLHLVVMRNRAGIRENF